MPHLQTWNSRQSSNLLPMISICLRAQLNLKSNSVSDSSGCLSDVINIQLLTSWCCSIVRVNLLRPLSRLGLCFRLIIKMTIPLKTILFNFPSAMNLLNSSVMPDLNFIQSEDEEGAAHEENRIQQRQQGLCGKKLLDSSLNNRLEPIPKHAFKPYHPPVSEPVQPQRPSFLFDFTVTEDNKALSHSSYDFIRNMNTSAQPDQLIKQSTYVPVALRQPETNETKPSDRWLDSHKEANSEGEEELAETPQLEQKHPKNQTKNIPKNYGKAIITFIEKNKSKVVRLLEGTDVSYADIMGEFKHKKRNINTIEHLRELWLTSKYAPEMRKISHLFLRKYALQYIFNSRITNYSSHIKYRHKLLEGVTNPQQFNNIKDY